MVYSKRSRAAGREYARGGASRILGGNRVHPEGDFHELGSFHLPSGKILAVWTVEGDCDPALLISNEFETEWPPHSGTRRSFPEVDRGAWFERALAVAKITKGQRSLIERFFEEHG